MPIIRRVSLPSSISGVEKSAGVELLERRNARPALGVQFDEGFVKDFLSYRVPVLRSLVMATQARPQMQDCMFFLIWRSYSAASESFIEWDKLRDQFWQADSNRSRIRSRFEEAITLVRTAWPELRAEAKSKGLMIAPPKNGIYFVPKLQKPKHVVEKAALEEKAQKTAAAETTLNALILGKRSPRERLFN